jgi:hypothetical protein
MVGSHKKMEQYYTPEMLDLVPKAYDIDYAIWDELHARAAINQPTQSTNGERLCVHQERLCFFRASTVVTSAVV